MALLSPLFLDINVSFTTDTFLATTPSLETPFESPVLIFGLAMLIFLLAPLLLKRYRLPGIIGVILVGAAIGPNGIGLLERGETIQLLGEVGIIYLMSLLRRRLLILVSCR